MNLPLSITTITTLLISMVAMSHGFLSENQLLQASSSTFAARPFMKHQQGVWARNNNKDTLDMKELKQRINEVNNPYHELFASADDAWAMEERPEEVHIILYEPNTDEQGLHSIEYPKGSGSNFVLAFQSKEACDKFADTLKAQNHAFDSYVIAPQRFFLDSLESMCDALGVFVQVVPEGMEIVPPSQNVQNLGQHNPHLREEKNHLDYLFDMFEMEADELGLVNAEVGAWE